VLVTSNKPNDQNWDTTIICHGTPDTWQLLYSIRQNSSFKVFLSDVNQNSNVSIDFSKTSPAINFIRSAVQCKTRTGRIRMWLEISIYFKVLQHMSWTPLWAPNIIIILVEHVYLHLFIIWKLQWPQKGYLHEIQLLGSVNHPMQILSIRVIMPRWVPRIYCRWSCLHNKYIQFKINSKRDRYTCTYMVTLGREKWNGHNRSETYSEKLSRNVHI
jgi:hypothetical protein